MFDYWNASTVGAGRPNVSSPNLIHIIEATYGMNCRGFTVGPGQVNRVKEGNATQTIAGLCDKAIDDCRFYFDFGVLGDPAPGCSKDLAISWRCGADEKVHGVRVAPEANSKLVAIVCPRR